MALTKISRSLLNTGISDSSDATAITIDSSERVGIGTTSPSAPLHIKKDSSETNLIVQSNTGGTGSAFGGRLRLQLGAQSNSGSGNADTQAGDTLGQIMFEGQGTDYSYQGGNIKCIVQTGDGDDGRSNQGTYMSFETIDVGSVSPAERMRIDQSGNVVIGSTSAGAKLDVNVNSSTAYSSTGESREDIIIHNTNGSDGSGVNNHSTLGFHVADGATSQGFISYVRTADNTGVFTFSQRTGSSSYAEAMRIDSSGNVGIGSPPSTTIRNDVEATEKALQVGRAAMLFSDSGLTTDLQNNTHLNNSDARVAMTGTLAASLMQQYQGITTFYTAPAVSAGSTQTISARFRIGLDGTLTGTDTDGIGSISDERVKKNIEDYTGGLDLVKSLRPRTFEFKDTTGIRKTDTQRGFIAQEVLAQDSYWISEEDASDTNDREYEYTKDTEKRYLSKLNSKDAMYVSAIKELHEQVEALQAEINTLKGE